MTAIENQDSRIEFGQFRGVSESPIQLTLDLENSQQETLFDSSMDLYSTEVPEFEVEIVVFNDETEESRQTKLQGQMDIKAFGAYPENGPDQLFLHYSNKDKLDMHDELNSEDNTEVKPQIPFQKSALYSRRRNRFSTH